MSQSCDMSDTGACVFFEESLRSPPIGLSVVLRLLLLRLLKLDLSYNTTESHSCREV